MKKILHEVLKVTVLSFPFLEIVNAMDPPSQTTENIQEREQSSEIRIARLFNKKDFHGLTEYAPKLMKELTPEILKKKTIPLSESSLFMIGQAYLETEHISDGVEEFTRLRSLVPDAPAVIHAWLGVYHQFSGDSHAHEKYEEAFRRNQNLDSFFNALAAMNYLNTAKYEQAIGQFDIAIKKTQAENQQPGTWLYEEKALACSKIERWDDAIGNYLLALQSSPTRTLEDPGNYTNLALAYYHKNMDTESLKWFDVAIQEAPHSDAITYFAAAEPAMNLKLWSKAGDFFEKGFARTNHPTAENYANAGFAFLNSEDWAKAYKYLDMALKLTPNLPQRIHDRRDQAYAHLLDGQLNRMNLN